MTWIRAVAAAGLSILLPGAGHALLRDWMRALLFGGLFLSGLYIFLPNGTLTDAGSLVVAGSVSEAMAVFTEQTDSWGQFTLMFITLSATIDATFRALGFPPNRRSNGGDGPACPNCGRELDEDLTFCHWCTTRLEAEPEPHS